MAAPHSPVAALLQATQADLDAAAIERSAHHYCRPAHGKSETVGYDGYASCPLTPSSGKITPAELLHAGSA